MAGLGQLTIRFLSGESWSIPFTGQQAQELADALDRVQDRQEWLILSGPDEQERDQILAARRGSMESILWVEAPGMMEDAASGNLGEDEAASG